MKISPKAFIKRALGDMQSIDAEVVSAKRCPDTLITRSHLLQDVFGLLTNGCRLFRITRYVHAMQIGITLHFIRTPLSPLLDLLTAARF